MVNSKQRIGLEESEPSLEFESKYLETHSLVGAGLWCLEKQFDEHVL